MHYVSHRKDQVVFLFLQEKLKVMFLTVNLLSTGAAPCCFGLVYCNFFFFSPDSSGHSSIRKLTTAMNEMNSLPAQLVADKFPHMAYINVRKARFSPDGFSALAELVSPSGLPLTTLVLDGMKLSGKKGLPTLFGGLECC